MVGIVQAEQICLMDAVIKARVESDKSDAVKVQYEVMNL